MINRLHFWEVPAELRRSPRLAAAHRQVIDAARAFERVAERADLNPSAAAAAYEAARLNLRYVQAAERGLVHLPAQRPAGLETLAGAA